MPILAIETSTSAGSFSVMKDEKIVFLDYMDMKITHSETIMNRIESALKNLNIDKKDLKAVCVSNGPGSFTGLRIGLATAKGICTGLEIPLIAFNSEEVLKANFAYCQNEDALQDDKKRILHLQIPLASAMFTLLDKYKIELKYDKDFIDNLEPYY